MYITDGDRQKCIKDIYTSTIVCYIFQDRTQYLEVVIRGQKAPSTKTNKSMFVKF